MNYEWELYREGLTRKVIVKSHPYDNIEVTVSKTLVNDKGEIIISSSLQSFYSRKEFVDFFEPIVNTLKKDIDNGIGN